MKDAHDIMRKALSVQGYGKDRRALFGLHKSGAGALREGINNTWILKTLSEDKGINALGLLGEKKLIYGGPRDEIKIADLEKDTTETLRGHGGKVFKVIVSKDGKYLLSGGKDKTIKFWDLKTGECLKTFEKHPEFKSLAIFPGSGYFASAGGSVTDSTVKIWNITTGECLRNFEGHSSGIETVSLTKDGKYLLSGSNDKTLKLWDVQSGKLSRTFLGHLFPVTSSDISFDGTRIISGRS